MGLDHSTKSTRKDEEGSESFKRQPEEERKKSVAELARTMYALSSVTKGQRQRVQDMLKNPDFCPNWNKVRSASLVFVDDKLQANSVLTLLCEQAEPIIHDFQDHLSDVRIRVSRLISQLDKNETTESLEEVAAGEKNNLPAKLIIILQLIKNMSAWAIESRESWVTYHSTRDSISSAAYLTQKDAVDTIDRGRAVAAWDCRKAGHTRSEVNSLLYKYIVLEDILYKTVLFLENNMEVPLSIKLYT